MTTMRHLMSLAGTYEIVCDTDDDDSVEAIDDFRRHLKSLLALIKDFSNDV